MHLTGNYSLFEILLLKDKKGEKWTMNATSPNFFYRFVYIYNPKCPYRSQIHFLLLCLVMSVLKTYCHKEV